MPAKTNLDFVLMDDPPGFADKAGARQEVADLREKYAEALAYIESLTDEVPGLCVDGESLAHDPNLPPVKEGVCLELFHGRQDPQVEMADWGQRGPVFGPYDGIHSTYAVDIKLVSNGDGYGRLQIVDGLVYYNGLYYGDWTVLSEVSARKDPDLHARLQAFNQEMADLPVVADAELVKRWSDEFKERTSRHIRPGRFQNLIDRLPVKAKGITFAIVDGEERIVRLPSWTEWRNRLLSGEFEAQILAISGVGRFTYDALLAEVSRA